MKRTLEVAPDLRVVDRAEKVEDALRGQRLRAADVVLLDLWMPGRTGLGAIREIAERMPVLVVSDTDESSPLAKEALAQGARAFIAKRDLATTSGALRMRSLVRAMARRRGAGAAGAPVIAVVGSTGAMEPLEILLRGLVGVEASVLIVQHMPEGREESFAGFIRGLGLDAKVASSGDAMEPGIVLVAKPGGHLVVRPESRVGIDTGPPVEGHRPSGTVLLASAKVLGPRVLAVILSGMGGDGAGAVPALVEAGGSCIVQEPSECAVASMPRAALAAARGVRAVPRRDLGVAAARWVTRRRRGEGL
jgi:two-component system chemotaxis response regulator CheB